MVLQLHMGICLYRIYDLIINSGDNPNMLQTFDLSFKSTTTISELEVLVEVEQVSLQHQLIQQQS